MFEITIAIQRWTAFWLYSVTGFIRLYGVDITGQSVGHRQMPHPLSAMIRAWRQRKGVQCIPAPISRARQAVPRHLERENTDHTGRAYRPKRTWPRDSQMCIFILDICIHKPLRDLHVNPDNCTVLSATFLLSIHRVPGLPHGTFLLRPFLRGHPWSFPLDRRNLFAASWWHRRAGLRLSALRRPFDSPFTSTFLNFRAGTLLAKRMSNSANEKPAVSGMRKKAQAKQTRPAPAQNQPALAPQFQAVVEIM